MTGASQVNNSVTPRDQKLHSVFINQNVNEGNVKLDTNYSSIGSFNTVSAGASRRLFGSNLNDESKPSQSINEKRLDASNNHGRVQDDSIFSRAFGEEPPIDHYNQNRPDQEEFKDSQQQVDTVNTSISYGSNGSFSRVNSLRKDLVQKPGHVIIHNIDKETTSHIIKDLNDQDLQDIDYSFIAQNILKIKFFKKESANWAIKQYDGQIINGRMLKVALLMQSSQKRRSYMTQLQQINETNDGDEDVDNESSTEKTPPNEPVKQPSFTSQKLKTQQSLPNKPQQQILNGNERNISQNQLEYQQTPQYVNISLTPPPGLQRSQTLNVSQQFQQYPQIPMSQSNIQQNWPVNQQNNSGQNYGMRMNQFYQQQQQHPLNSESTQAIMPSQANHQNYERFKQNQTGGLEYSQQMPQRYSMPMQYQQVQHQSQHPIQLQNFEQNFKNKEIDPQTAFGYHSSSSGLMLQQPLPQPQLQSQPSQLIFNENINNFSKISSSCDNFSQEDDIAFQIPQDQYSNSDRGSFYQQTHLVNNRNQVITGSTQNSDSDNNHQIQAQLQATQHFQSPISGQKVATQKFHDNSFDHHNKSFRGQDTPPSYFTPGSSSNNKHLNNSFQFHQTSHQQLNLFRQDFSQMGINNHHQRNFSHQYQLGQPGEGSNPLHIQQQQYYMSQQLNFNNILQRSVSYAQIQHYPSSSSDINDINFYGVPLQPQQYQQNLSSLNSSFDMISLSGANKKRKSHKEFKSHQTLKHTYSESSLLTHDQSVYELDIEKIKQGDDHRTSVMVRNIPNKYTQRFLLQEINENHIGKYDFLYLPIDFQNSANVGYAFINFVHPLFILDFYQEFHMRKWIKFNSNKICDIKYGRIQGLEQLKNHFRCSSVMNQTDENLRPRIFEQNNRKDWTNEIRKIMDKYKIVTPIEKFSQMSLQNQMSSMNQSINSSSRYEPSQSIEELPEECYNVVQRAVSNQQWEESQNNFQ